MHLLYYVTSHGYGHGVRTVAICNALSADVRITFRTTLPEQFFREEVHRAFDYAPASFDCGCLQTDSVTTDIEKTLATYSAIAHANESLLDSEEQWCRQRHVDCIASDITPFAFAVAQRRLIPSVAVTNFTWYDIYKPYTSDNPSFLPILDRMKAQYSSASLLCALEPALPMDFFPNRKDIPPVGRSGRDRRAEILEKFRFNPGKKLGLIYFGHFGLQGVAWRNLAKFSEWEFLGIWPLEGAPSNYHLISKSEFPYQDLIASADIMICKVGYGTVAECMLHGTPIMYLPRSDFAEYSALDTAVRAWGGAYPISDQAFLSLDWEATLNLAARRSRPKKLPSNGARICAQEIERLGGS